MMVVKKHGVIIETPTEARQAEPGPSVLLLLVVSLSIAVIVMAVPIGNLIRLAREAESRNASVL
jgi:hypothetical protein